MANTDRDRAIEELLEAAEGVVRDFSDDTRGNCFILRLRTAIEKVRKLEGR